MNTIGNWLNSCSFDDPYFKEVDELIQKLIQPFFDHGTALKNLEEFITTTIKLKKEVEFIRDQILGDQLHVNYISRNEFGYNVMKKWIEKYPEYASIIKAICYELDL